ncbi:hypothetical protein L6452_30837 [Arctium lappa]|uniref:Uncharacterized protein n=1 Tax=Arctium lappa TaxID=4217 RepID=A0ACB8ZK99_ARCLA|nr:hypothetical protein L6452_30837 [Arctium lappa]
MMEIMRLRRTKKTVEVNQLLREAQIDVKEVAGSSIIGRRGYGEEGNCETSSVTVPMALSRGHYRAKTPTHGTCCATMTCDCALGTVAWSLSRQHSDLRYISRDCALGTVV